MEFPSGSQESRRISRRLQSSTPTVGGIRRERRCPHRLRRHGETRASRIGIEPLLKFCNRLVAGTQENVAGTDRLGNPSGFNELSDNLLKVRFDSLIGGFQGIFP